MTRRQRAQVALWAGPATGASRRWGGVIACPACLADRPLAVAGDDRAQPPTPTARFGVLAVHTGRTDAPALDRLGQPPGGPPAPAAHRQQTAQDVGNAIVDALRRPRFEVFVPRSVGPTIRFALITGRRFADWLQRALKADTVLMEAANSGARGAYEARAAASAPGADRELDGGR